MTGNITIRDVPESTSDQPLHRIEADKKWIADICQIQMESILKCWRMGEVKEGRPRLLVATLSTLEYARELHNYGDGRREDFSGQRFWINADLTAAERVANYKARMQRKRRRQQAVGMGGTSGQGDEEPVLAQDSAASNL